MASRNPTPLARSSPSVTSPTGRDENVLAIRRGNVARIHKAWVEKDTMQASREFVYMLRGEGIHPSQVWGMPMALAPP